jgi:hypothetical protein
MEKTMKAAEVYAVGAQTARKVVWKWRSNDHTKSSSLSFVCQEACMEDAKKNGYAAVLRSRAG